MLRPVDTLAVRFTELVKEFQPVSHPSMQELRSHEPLSLYDCLKAFSERYCMQDCLSIWLVCCWCLLLIKETLTFISFSVNCLMNIIRGFVLSVKRINVLLRHSQSGAIQIFSSSI